MCKYDYATLCKNNYAICSLTAVEDHFIYGSIYRRDFTKMLDITFHMWHNYINIHWSEDRMRKRQDQKLQALEKLGCLHKRPEQVIDELFEQSEFFDPRDLIQVKYEMLRQVRVDAKAIRQVAGQFGFSRPSVYKALAAFQAGG